MSSSMQPRASNHTGLSAHGQTTAPLRFSPFPIYVELFFLDGKEKKYCYFAMQHSKIYIFCSLALQPQNPELYKPNAGCFFSVSFFLSFSDTKMMHSKKMNQTLVWIIKHVKVKLTLHTLQKKCEKIPSRECLNHRLLQGTEVPILYLI